MIFSGIQKTSTIDYPGMLCSVLFTSGCMFRCHYCHNSELVFSTKNACIDQLITDHFNISEEEMLDILLKRKNFVSAVSITGGEVTLNKDIIMFVDALKDNGFKVKIDTNGTNPNIIKKLLPKLDFIAMDVKAIDEKHYEETVGVYTDFSNIKKSISLIMNSGVDYEFRTTVVPTLFPIDKFDYLGELLKGSKKHVIQQFVNRNTLNPIYEDVSPYTPSELYEIRNILRKYIELVEIRGI